MVTTLRNFALIIACALSTQIGANPKFNPNNTEFFFDLHDVVLKVDKKERIKLGFQNIGASLKLAFSKVSRKGCANGEAYALKLRKNGYSKEAELVRKMSAAYKVNTDVVEIIKALQAKGYTVSMASNIGAQHLEDLMNPNHIKSRKKRKTRAKVQNAIASFEDLIFVDYESDTVIAKPSREYFEVLRNTCGHDTHAIFIDDSCPNVVAARHCGLHGVHFTSAKQLKKDLQKLGIL